MSVSVSRSASSLAFNSDTVMNGESVISHAPFPPLVAAGRGICTVYTCNPFVVYHLYSICKMLCHQRLPPETPAPSAPVRHYAQLKQHPLSALLSAQVKAASPVRRCGQVLSRIGRCTPRRIFLRRFGMSSHTLLSGTLLHPLLTILDLSSMSSGT